MVNDDSSGGKPKKGYEAGEPALASSPAPIDVLGLERRRVALRCTDFPEAALVEHKSQHIVILSGGERGSGR